MPRTRAVAESELHNRSSLRCRQSARNRDAELFRLATDVDSFGYGSEAAGGSVVADGRLSSGQAASGGGVEDGVGAGVVDEEESAMG